MISVYLDDQRTPLENPSDNTEWIVVKNFEEFTDLVEKTGPNIILKITKYR